VSEAGEDFEDEMDDKTDQNSGDEQEE